MGRSRQEYKFIATKKKTQMCFGTLGEQQIKKVYDCLLTILTEDEDEE